MRHNYGKRVILYLSDYALTKVVHLREGYVGKLLQIKSQANTQDLHYMR